MKKNKIVFLVVLLVFIACVGLFATGQKESAVKPGQSKRVVTTVTLSSFTSQEWYKKMNAAFTAETGIEVSVQPTPGNDVENILKVNTDLLAGGTVDVIATLGANTFYSRVKSGFFAPLSKLISNAGINADKVWGKYLPRDKKGEYYGLPYKQEISCLYYNKNIFDNAGVPYPKAPWTWSDFVKIAGKLTNPSKGIYGIQNRLEIPGILFQAIQKKVPYYKENGMSNFDDPAFAASLKWYYDLGNVKKYQMSVRELKAENASWDYWARTNNQGMFIQGNWFMRVLDNLTSYPRDWHYGIVAVPTSGTPEGNNDFASMAYVSVNKNAKHPAEALKYMIWLAKNQWKFEKGLPALVNLTPEQNKMVFKAAADASKGDVTVEDLRKALIDNGMGVVNTDIVGPAASEYKNIILEEAEKYCLDQQNLKSTIKNIKSRVDEALKNLK